ncbi:MAG: 5-formyltetrahydrofolate cyclo-ligase [Actinomycetes bacterium]
MNDIALAKAQLRSKILAERISRTNPELDEINLTNQLLSQVERTQPKRVATYLSFGSEPSTKLFIQELLRQGIEVLVPKVNGTAMLWFRFDGTSTVTSVLGMQEPNSDVLDQVDLLQTDLMVLPALAVDGLGNRLGRGKGYFDRSLASSVGHNTFAVCFESEFLESLPSAEHDIRVQGLVTELAIHDLN